MSLTVKSVMLIRKTDISLEDAETFLVEALEICTGGTPGNVDWQTVNRVVRGRSRGEEVTITDAWQPGPMLDVRRTRVESYNLNEEAELELSGSRTTFSVRNLPDEGSFEFRVDNTRLKGASMEVYASATACQDVVTTFQGRFQED